MTNNSIARKKANQNSSNQIKDSETLKQLGRIYEDIIIHDNIKDAFKFSNIIESKIIQIKLADTDKELSNKYQDFVIKLKWVALPWLKNQEVLGLFKNHFTKIFEIEFFNIWEKLKKKLLTLLLLKERDELKEQIKNALLASQEKITSQKLTQSQAPTISNWLKDYTSKLGANPTNKAKQAEYLTNSENIKSLSEPEKNKLRTLFNLFERAKLSSSTIEGIEEPIPVFDDPNNEGEIIDGQFVKYQDKEKIIANLKKMAKIIGLGNFKEEAPEKESKKPTPVIKPKEEKTDIDNIHKLAQQIISQSNIKLQDQNLNSRFQNIILSRLRNVRNFITTKEALTRQPKIGGLGITQDQAEKIARLIETEATKIHQSEEVIKQEKEKQPRNYLDNILQGYSLEREIKKKSAQSGPASPQHVFDSEVAQTRGELGTKAGWNKIVNKDKEKIKPITFTPDKVTADKLSTSKPQAIPASNRQAATPTSRQAVPIKMQGIKPSFAKASGGVPPPFKPQQAPLSPNKPIKEINAINTAAQPPSRPAATPSSIKRVESISQPQRLTGEIEEMGALKLVDFRRWSTEPAESAARVKEKIELIEKESIEKKAQAILAWKGSEINKLYLDMGQYSMLQGQSIEEIIKIREAENKPTLSLAEFEAIADLNKELNF